MTDAERVAKAWVESVCLGGVEHGLGQRTTPWSGPMADLDLDARLALAEKLGAAVMSMPVAEARRLRAVRDAAANLQEQREDCDNQTWVEGRTCRDAVGDEPDDWCATCALVQALEESGRG